MKTDKQQTETSFGRDLDPYADMHTFPGLWDLSDLPQLPEQAEDLPQSREEQQTAPVEHGLGPGALDEWHLAAALDEYLARLRRGWSAY